MEWLVTEIGLRPRGYWTCADEDLVAHGGSEQVVPSFDSCARVSDTGTARRVSGDLTMVANSKKKKKNRLRHHHQHPPHTPFTNKKQIRNTRANTKKHCHDQLSTDADMPSAPQPSIHRTQKNTANAQLSTDCTANMHTCTAHVQLSNDRNGAATNARKRCTRQRHRMRTNLRRLRHVKISADCTRNAQTHSTSKNSKVWMPK